MPAKKSDIVRRIFEIRITPPHPQPEPEPRPDARRPPSAPPPPPDRGKRGA